MKHVLICNCKHHIHRVNEALLIPRSDRIAMPGFPKRKNRCRTWRNMAKSTLRYELINLGCQVQPTEMSMILWLGFGTVGTLKSWVSNWCKKPENWQWLNQNHNVKCGFRGFKYSRREWKVFWTSTRWIKRVKHEMFATYNHITLY